MEDSNSLDQSIGNSIGDKGAGDMGKLRLEP